MKSRKRVLALALVALAAAAVIAESRGWIRVADPGLTVVASAPRAGGGLTVFALSPGRLADLRGLDATYEIRYGGVVVYPPGGLGGTFPIERGRGTVFVPYNLFVVGNGIYEIAVRYGGDEAVVRTPVEKWVSYVYLHPYDRGSAIVVDAQLSRSPGGLPSDRVNADGTLQLDLFYRGKQGDERRFIGRVAVETDAAESFTRLAIPRGKFTEGAGYYSVEALFHNAQAKNNVNVGNDPIMAQRNPPWNWIYLSR